MTLRDLTGEGVRSVPELAPRHDLADEADLECLRGREDAPGEEHVLRASCAELPGVAMIFDPADRHQHHRIREERILRGDDQIHRKDQVQRAGDRLPLDGRDRRLRDVAPMPGIAEVLLAPPSGRSCPAGSCRPAPRASPRPGGSCRGRARRRSACRRHAARSREPSRHAPPRRSIRAARRASPRSGHWPCRRGRA